MLEKTFWINGNCKIAVHVETNTQRREIFGEGISDI